MSGILMMVSFFAHKADLQPQTPLASVLGKTSSL
jgi:hypothetical protein